MGPQPDCDSQVVRATVRFADDAGIRVMSVSRAAGSGWTLLVVLSPDRAVYWPPVHVRLGLRTY